MTIHRFAIPPITLSRWLCLWSIVVLPASAVGADPAPYFAIEVVDEETGRGVPLVQLETTGARKYVTDSAGLVAFYEPGLMNQNVFFTITSHGYEYPADGFGMRGVVLKPTAGGSARLKIKRLNIAERLYRITGEGIYRDSILLGRKAPIEHPLLNSGVVGLDSVLATVYRGKIFWFWGDTTQTRYPLGNFATTGATSELPGNGGLPPSVGVNLRYFDDRNGFVRKMVPLNEPGCYWIDGLMTLNDDQGRERLIAHYTRVKGLEARLGRGLLVFNDERQVFEQIKPVDLDAPLSPAGHPFRITENGQEYVYFPVPYPSVRVKADWESVMDLSSYEAFTPLIPGTRFAEAETKLDRTDSGKLNWSWKHNTPPIRPAEQEQLVELGLMKREESPFRLQDVEDGKPIQLHGGSVYWNGYRQKYILIGLELNGTSMLGEVWFAESVSPAGPWIHAKKIVTHNRMDFYNPTQHPFFDEDNGRFIYFEGTYVNTFSGNPEKTPGYDYNQIMYRLDLADPRLKLPESPAP